jgi:Na+:H+ antiporter, NhaA family
MRWASKGAKFANPQLHSFFLLIGLELEREIYHGDLSKIKNASLPVFGATGGMIVPAGLFLLLNFGTDTQAGAGIPMATDIAFAIGILCCIQLFMLQ